MYNTQDRTSTMDGLVSGLLFTLLNIAQSVNFHKPFGIRMCQELCRVTSDCGKYKYFQQYLACHIERTSLVAETNMTRSILEKTMGNLTEMEQIAHNLKNSLSSKDNTGIVEKRVLFASYYDLTRIQRKLGTKSIHPYPYLNVSDISSVAYSSKSKKMFLSTVVTKKILTSSLSSKSSTLLIAGVSVTAMAINEEQGSLIFTNNRCQDTYAGYCVCKITGTSYKIVESFPVPLISIALDPTRDTIFTCSKNIIYVIRNGAKEVLAKGHRTDHLAFDPKEDFLYYHKKISDSKYQLMNVHIRTKVTREIKQLEGKPCYQGPGKSNNYVLLYDLYIGEIDKISMAVLMTKIKFERFGGRCLVLYISY